MFSLNHLHLLQSLQQLFKVVLNLCSPKHIKLWNKKKISDYAWPSNLDSYIILIYKIPSAKIYFLPKFIQISPVVVEKNLKWTSLQTYDRQKKIRKAQWQLSFQLSWARNCAKFCYHSAVFPVNEKISFDSFFFINIQKDNTS